MNTATYTKIVTSKTYNDNSMSLGFRRYTCLPKHARLNLGIAYYMATGNVNDHDYNVRFFENMTESEYKTYVTTH